MASQHSCTTGSHFHYQSFRRNTSTAAFSGTVVLRGSAYRFRNRGRPSTSAIRRNSSPFVYHYYPPGSINSQCASIEGDFHVFPHEKSGHGWSLWLSLQGSYGDDSRSIVHPSGEGGIIYGSRHFDDGVRYPLQVETRPLAIKG